MNLANDSLQADHLNSCQQSLPDFKFAAKADVQKTSDCGMFKLVLRRKNYEISGSLRYLQSAGFVGIFILVQKHMNASKIGPAKGFLAQLAPSLSRILQNFPQVLRHTLRWA